ncbi:MAG TPA: hypothetical protein VNU70_09825 [Puia sp.]|jgi:hypothetical protein|nr:hypothetical protein [Puia sp.]
MDFDFYDQFSKYSSTELLKIVKQPDLYQPEALAAAGRLLQERQVSAAEEEEADRQFESHQQQAIHRARRFDAYKEQVADIVEPVLAPGAPLTPARSYKILVVGYSVIYGWLFYDFVRRQIRFLQSADRWIGSLAYDFVQIAYLSVLLYLLIRNADPGNMYGGFFMAAFHRRTLRVRSAVEKTCSGGFRGIFDRLCESYLIFVVSN